VTIATDSGGRRPTPTDVRPALGVLRRWQSAPCTWLRDEEATCVGERIPAGQERSFWRGQVEAVVSYWSGQGSGDGQDEDGQAVPDPAATRARAPSLLARAVAASRRLASCSVPVVCAWQGRAPEVRRSGRCDDGNDFVTASR
jgi:hypothetical protein